MDSGVQELQSTYWIASRPENDTSSSASRKPPLAKGARSGPKVRQPLAKVSICDRFQGKGTKSRDLVYLVDYVDTARVPLALLVASFEAREVSGRNVSVRTVSVAGLMRSCTFRWQFEDLQQQRLAVGNATAPCSFGSFTFVGGNEDGFSRSWTVASQKFGQRRLPIIARNLERASRTMGHDKRG